MNIAAASLQPAEAIWPFLIAGYVKKPGNCKPLEYPELLKEYVLLPSNGILLDAYIKIPG